MKNFDKSIELNHTPNWSTIPDRPSKIFMVKSLKSREPDNLIT